MAIIYLNAKWNTPLQLLIFALLVASCNTETDKEQSLAEASKSSVLHLSDAQLRNVALTTDSLQFRDIKGKLQLSGIIDVPPQNLASISMPMGGYVKQIKLLPGMPFRKGEVLATIEDQQFIQLQQEYLLQKTNLKLAKAEFDRQETLNATQATSSKNKEQAEAAYLTAKTNVHAIAAKLKLIHIDPEKLTDQNIRSTVNIYAPFDGFVSKVYVNTGKYVSPSDVLFELVDPTDMHLNLKVFENDLIYLQQGLQLEAYTNKNSTKRYPCSVLLISKNISEEKTAEVHCHFNNYDKELIPGMFMNAEVTITRKKVASIASEAVVNFEGRQYVFIAKTDNTYEMIEVNSGGTTDGYTELIDWPLFDKKIIVTKGAYTLLMALKNAPEEE